MNIPLEQYVEAYNQGDDVLGMFKSEVYRFSKKGSYLPDPYTGFRLREIQSKYLNITETYRRVSSPTKHRNPSARKKIFFYGGSVMFGYYAVSDKTTIPGFISSINKELDTFNYALPAATISQNFSHYTNKVLGGIDFLNGKHQVVCLIGYNEFLSAYKYKNTYGNPVVSIHNALWGPSKTGQLVYKIPMYKSRLGEPRKETFEISNLISSTISSIEVFKTVVNAFGGEFVLFIQPSLLTSCKVRKNIEVSQEIDKQFLNLYTKFVDSVLNYFVNNRMVFDLTSIFDDCKSQIYIDQVHVGTKGNRIIADEIVSVI